MSTALEVYYVRYSAPSEYDHRILLVSTINPPHLDFPGTIPTNNPTSKWRVNAGQRCDRILVRPKQGLLTIGQQRHALGRAVLLAAGLCRGNPRLNITRSRTSGR